jgi:hypothetical protein
LRLQQLNSVEDRIGRRRSPRGEGKGKRRGFSFEEVGGARASIAPPALRTQPSRLRVPARISARGPAYLAVMTALPQVPRRGRRQEDAADHDAILQHVVIVVAPLAGRARGRGAAAGHSAFFQSFRMRSSCCSNTRRICSPPALLKLGRFCAPRGSVSRYSVCAKQYAPWPKRYAVRSE